MIFIIKKTALLTIFFVAALLVACDEVPQEQPTMPQETEQETEPLEEAGEEETSNDSPENFQEEFMNIVSQMPSYRVDYDFESNTQGASETAEMTWFVSGSEQMRIDSAMDTPQGFVNSRSIISDDEFISCIQDQGSWQCYSFGSDDDMTELDDASSLTESIDDWEQNAGSLEFLDVDRRVILDEEVSCFRFVDQEATQEVCYTEDGVMLYMENEFSEGNQIMQATSYSSSVSNSDFEPPVEPQSMEDMMEAMMGEMEDMDW